MQTTREDIPKEISKKLYEHTMTSRILLQLCALLVLLYSNSAAATSDSKPGKCSLEHFQSQTRDLKRFDSGDLSKYQQVAAKLEPCLDETHRDLLLFNNEIHYKMGLIHLSMGNDMKAIKSFEGLQSLGDSYYNLSKTRLSDLYVEFGLWLKLKELIPEDDTGEIFESLNKTLYEKINDPDKLSTIDDELVPMLNISPYDLDTLTIRADFLFHKLFTTKTLNDITSAYEIVRIYDVILEKHKIALTLDQRIEIHYTAALLQLLILNSEPTLHLRKCLAIDMDYKPCKDLSLLVSRLNKINPSRSQLFDTQSYALGSNVDWKKVSDYYLSKKRENIVNYQWINNKITELVNSNTDLLITNRPVTKGLFKFNPETPLVDDAANFSFFRFIDIIVCEASMQLTHTNDPDKKKYKKAADHFCKKALKLTLNDDEWNQFMDAMNKKETQLPDEFTTNLWNTYPTLATYMVEKIISRKNFRGGNEHLQTHIIKFFQDNELFGAENPVIKAQASVIKQVFEKKQKLDQQRQRQQQQQHQQQQFNFFQQFANGQHGQQQQYQQRAPPQQPGHNPDKDYYKILGVAKDANTKDIRKAYLNLTKKYHPDKQGSLSEDEQKKVHEKMSEINEAYEFLSDDSKRNEYDQGRAGGRPGGQNQGFNFQGQGNPFPFGNMRRGF